MNVKIDDLIFERANYDADGDVLYLARGETNMAADAVLTPEGHGVRYGPERRGDRRHDHQRSTDYASATDT